MEVLMKYWLEIVIGGLTILTSVLVTYVFNRHTRRQLASASKERESQAKQSIRSMLEKQALRNGSLPSTAVLEAMISAAGRKHGVGSSVRYGIEELRQDIVLTVMGSDEFDDDEKERRAARLLEGKIEGECSQTYVDTITSRDIPTLQYMIVVREFLEFSVALSSLAATVLFALAAGLGEGAVRVGVIGAGAITSLALFLNLVILIVGTIRIRVWTITQPADNHIEGKDDVGD